MGNRHMDWLRQAQADLRHARHALGVGDYEWSCFAAHQVAEKALRALFRQRGMDAWGHTLTALIGNLPADLRPTTELIDYARALDKHYILTRYPDGFDSGAPTDFYTRSEAEHAVQHAEAVLTFCRDQIGGSRAG